MDRIQRLDSIKRSQPRIDLGRLQRVRQQSKVCRPKEPPVRRIRRRASTTNPGRGRLPGLGPLQGKCASTLGDPNAALSNERVYRHAYAFYEVGR